MTLDRPETTLFSIISVDGKISTGDTDQRDQEIDFPRIQGIKEGLQQYYDLLSQTDRTALITGRTMAKIGVNSRVTPEDHKDVELVVIDRKPHLTQQGLEFLCNSFGRVFLVTTNRAHPGYQLKCDNLEILFYSDDIDLEDLFKRLKRDFGIKKLSIQSGGTLNSILLLNKFIDHLSVVIAPALIGGKTTPTLIDGVAPKEETDLDHIKSLVLRKCEVLNDSYLHLLYDVLKDTKISSVG